MQSKQNRMFLIRSNLVIILLLAFVTFSCNKKQDAPVEEKTSLIDPTNPLNKLKYVNKIDFYCKMDNTKYGIADTITYKGKLYGFCSALCKNEFLLQPEVYLAKQ